MAQSNAKVLFKQYIEKGLYREAMGLAKSQQGSGWERAYQFAADKALSQTPSTNSKASITPLQLGVIFIVVTLIIATGIILVYSSLQSQVTINALPDTVVIVTPTAQATMNPTVVYETWTQVANTCREEVDIQEAIDGPYEPGDWYWKWDACMQDLGYPVDPPQ